MRIIDGMLAVLRECLDLYNASGQSGAVAMRITDRVGPRRRSGAGKGRERRVRNREHD